MRLKDIEEEIKSGRSLANFLSVIINSSSSYFIIISTAVLIILNFVQFFHLRYFTKTSNPGGNALILLGGIVVFVVAQTSIVERLLNFVTIKLSAWLWLAILFCALPIALESDTSIYRRTVPVFGANINTGFLAITCVIVFFSLLGGRIIALTRSEYTKYGGLLIIFAGVCLAQPNLALLKTTFFVTLSFFAIFGKKKQAIEIFFALLVLLTLLVFASEFRAARVMTLFNPETSPLDKGYQAVKALKAWSTSEWIRMGFKGPISIYVPRLTEEMAFSGTVQLWGKVGVVLIFLLTPLQFFSLTNAIARSSEPRIALLAFGTFVVYLQSVMISLLMAICLHPATTQLAGAGLLGSGAGIIFTLFALGLAYRVTSRQNPNYSSLILPAHIKICPLTVDVEALNRTVLLISLIIIFLALFSVQGIVITK